MNDTSPILEAHQRSEGDDLQEALQGEEAGEHDVQVLQHGLVQLGSSMELKGRQDKLQ